MLQGVLSPKIVRHEINQIDKLFSSPIVASEVLKYLESNQISVTHLTELISIDAVLVARIMKLANSESYGYSGQISTLNLAIITIGLPSLIDLLRGISAVDQFNSQFIYLHRRLQNLWLHSAIVGAGAKKLSNLIGYPVSGEAFVAGLLHDIGYQVLYRLYPDHLSEVFKLSKKSGITVHEADNLKTSDASDIGGKVLDIRYHVRDQRRKPSRTRDSRSGLDNFFAPAPTIALCNRDSVNRRCR